MVVSVSILFLAVAVLGIVALLTAITQFKSLTGVACMGIMGLSGWYMAAVVTPPGEYDAVPVQITHTQLPGGSETLAIARNPATNKNVVWRYEGKPEDKVRAFFPDRNKPRLNLSGVSIEDKPRLVHD